MRLPHSQRQFFLYKKQALVSVVAAGVLVPHALFATSPFIPSAVGSSAAPSGVTAVMPNEAPLSQLFSDIAVGAQVLGSELQRVIAGAFAAVSRSTPATAHHAQTAAANVSQLSSATTTYSSQTDATTTRHVSTVNHLSAITAQPAGNQNTPAEKTEPPNDLSPANQTLVTQEELTEQLNALRSSLLTRFSAPVQPVPQQVAAGGAVFSSAPIIAPAVNNITNVTVTGGINGLTAADIPDLSSQYFKATSTISIAYGGTGTSTAPGPRKLLLSDANGRWEYVATSSLGIISGGPSAAFAWMPAANFGVIANATTTPIWFKNGLQASSTSQLAAASFSGNVGIGTSTPGWKLAVAGTTTSSSFYIPGTTAGSGLLTFAGVNGASAFNQEIRHEVSGNNATLLFNLDHGSLPGSNETNTIRFNGPNTSLEAINANDSLGFKAAESFSTGFLGLVNTGGSANGSVPGNGFLLTFALGNGGKVGSIVPTTGYGSPSWRNVLDDGSGNMTVTGSAGIGTNSLSHRLMVESGDSNATVGIENTANNGYSGIHFLDLSGTLVGQLGYANPGASASLADSFYLGSIAGKKLNFTTSNTVRMTLDASGNVGIGTTTPGSLLSLGSTGANTVNISNTATSTFGHGINIKGGCFAVNGVCIGGGSVSAAFAWTHATNFGLGVNSTSTPIWFKSGLQASSTSQLAAANFSGNVGIGTTNPATNLDVENSASTSFAFQVKQNNASGYGAYIFANSNSATIDALNVQGWTGSALINALDVKSNGRVGIGTTSPTSALSVSSADNGNGVIVTSSGNNAGIQLNNIASGGRIWQILSGAAASAASPASFGIQDATAGLTRFIINSSGNVGIGTTTPGSLLSLGNTGANTANISVTATSTFGHGINIKGGCFAINGVCVGKDTVTTLSNVSTYSTAGSYTWTKPVGLDHVVIDVLGGGGGGGGGGNSSGSAGGGGGAGGVSSFGSFVTAVGGGGGGGGSTYTVNGVNGGSTSGTTSGGGFSAGTGGAGGCCGSNSSNSGGAGGNAGFSGYAGGAGGSGSNNTGHAGAGGANGGGIGGTPTSGGGGGGGGGAGPGGGNGGNSGIAGGSATMNGSGGGGGGGGGGNWYPGGGGGGGTGGFAQDSIAASSLGATVSVTVGAGGTGGTSGAGAGGTGGAGQVTVYEFTTHAAGADLAEMYPVNDQTIAAGDIVSVDGNDPITMGRAVAGSGKPLAGIVSTNPGVVLKDKDSGVLDRPIALAGRVPTKVNLEGGTIKIGDRIAISSVPGVGKKATSLEDSVGIALEPYDGTGTSTIKVLIDLERGTDVNAIGTALLATSTSTSSPSFVDQLVSVLTGKLFNPIAPVATTTAIAKGAAGFVGNLFSTITKWFADAGNGIHDFFAQNIHASNEICIGQTCVTESQLKELLASRGANGGQPAAASASQGVPVIEIQGANPAHIALNSSYVDLGARITGPTQADTNLGLSYYVDGKRVQSVSIDTASSSTHTIDYVAVNSSGTATSTRTVIVEAQTTKPQTTSDAQATSTQTTATTTEILATTTSPTATTTAPSQNQQQATSTPPVTVTATSTASSTATH